MANIIISYRRSDSAAIAGRIRDRLAEHYGADAVFMDIDSIPRLELIFDSKSRRW